MTLIDQRIRIQDLERDRDMFTKLLVERRFYYVERLIKIDERLLNYILNISALAIGALALLGSQRVTSRFYDITFSLFFLSLFLSTFVLIITFITEPEKVKMAKDEEIGSYERLQKSADEIIKKSQYNSLLEQDFKNHANLLKSIEQDIRGKKENKFLHILLKFIIVSALGTFFTGIIFLYLYFNP